MANIHKKREQATITENISLWEGELVLRDHPPTKKYRFEAAALILSGGLATCSVPHGSVCFEPAVTSIPLFGGQGQLCALCR